jgi:hypothetical protein
MSRRRRAYAAITPVELENPERDLDLTTRGPVVKAEEQESTGAPDAALGDRIAAAGAMNPPDVACRACWQHGRDAAIQAVAGAGIEAARAILPTGSALHWRECWTQGRDAALAVIEGR